MLVDNQEINGTTSSIIGAAIEVHRELGPGLLESVYCTCLQYELAQRGLRFEVQRVVPVRYKELILAATLRVDLVVEDRVIVEVKSIAEVLPVHRAQALTYAKLIGCAAGLVINFNVPRLVDGVHRVLNAERWKDGR